MEKRIDNNFLWVLRDISKRYVLKVFYKDMDGNNTFGVFNAKEINRLDNSELSVSDGNIADIDNLFMGMVRFVNDTDDSLILDIPLRNLYMLESDKKVCSKNINFSNLYGFSPIDILDMEVYYMDDISSNLIWIEGAFKDYFGMNNQDKFMVIKKFNEINNSHNKENYQRKR